MPAGVQKKPAAAAPRKRPAATTAPNKKPTLASQARDQIYTQAAAAAPHFEKTGRSMNTLKRWCAEQHELGEDGKTMWKGVLTGLSWKRPTYGSGKVTEEWKWDPLRPRAKAVPKAKGNKAKAKGKNKAKDKSNDGGNVGIHLADDTFVAFDD